MSAQRGFLFNGAAIGGGHGSDEDDDSDYEDEETPMHYEASFQPSSNASSSSAAAAAAPVAPLVPIFGDMSKLKRGVGLPMLGPQRRPNSAEDIRDLTMRSELETEFWEDVDKMLHKRPPSLKHFSKDKQLPKMRNQLRAAKLQQHKRVSGPPKKSFSTSSKGLDTKLLAEAQQYVARTCAKGQINSSKLLHSQPPPRSGKSPKFSKKKGMGKKKKSSKNKKYRKKPSSAPCASSSINRRLAYGLKRSASSKAAKAGKKIDIQALIENFQTGSTVEKLRRQLAKSKQSKSVSEKFINSAKAEWLT